MKETRKNYSKEFKQKAVELGNVRGNVQEIARELGIRAELIYRWRREMVADPSLAFGGKGKAWVSDITYVKTSKGWLYLTVVLDIFDRKVIYWSQSSDMNAENTSIAAWRMAVRNRPPSKDLIFHSDRGVPYAYMGS